MAPPAYERTVSLLKRFSPNEPSAESKERLLHNLRQRHVPVATTPDSPAAAVVGSPVVRLAAGYVAAGVAVWTVFALIPLTGWTAMGATVLHSTQRLVALVLPNDSWRATTTETARQIQRRQRALPKILDDQWDQALAQLNTPVRERGG